MRLLEYNQENYWPDRQDFQKLRQRFNTVLVPQVENLLSYYHQSNTENLSNLLFGIYLHNYSSENKIIESKAKQNNRTDFDPDNINNWPINITGIQPRINVSNEKFPRPNIILNIPFSFINTDQKTFSFSVDEQKYQIPFSVMSILLGVEEANHILIYSLSNQGIIPRPKNIESLGAIERESDKDNYVVRYYSQLGLEFEACKAKSCVCKKYFPDQWNQSFKYLDQCITNRRAISD